MTPEQQATLKAYTLADPAWVALPLNSDTSYFIADELRKEASPAFVVWMFDFVQAPSGADIQMTTGVFYRES